MLDGERSYKKTVAVGCCVSSLVSLRMCLLRHHYRSMLVYITAYNGKSYLFHYSDLQLF